MSVHRAEGFLFLEDSWIDRDSDSRQRKKGGPPFFSSVGVRCLFKSRRQILAAPRSGLLPLN